MSGKGYGNHVSSAIQGLGKLLQICFLDISNIIVLNIISINKKASQGH